MKRLFIAFLLLTVLCACSACDSGNKGDEEAIVTYTVTINVNNAEYGSVDKTTISNVVSGASISANGNVLTIGDEQITATPALATAEFSYTFDKFVYTEIKVSGNITVIAEFAKTEIEYDVVFMVEGNDYGEPIKAKYNSKILEPNSPEKQADSAYEYAFDGWYNGDIKWDFDNDTVNANIVLTAKFKTIGIEYDVVFKVESNDYGEPIKAKYNSKILEPNSPEKQADSAHEYAFDGWYNGDIKWDFDNDTVNANIVLTAKFKTTVLYTEEFLPSGN